MEAVISFLFVKLNVQNTGVLVGILIYIKKLVDKQIANDKKYIKQTTECTGKFNVMGNEITHIKKDVEEHRHKISKLEEFKIKWNEKYEK